MTFASATLILVLVAIAWRPQARVSFQFEFSQPVRLPCLYLGTDISTEAARAASKSRHRPDRCRRHRRRNRRSPS